MFNSLPQFYNSKEWRSFRKSYIAEILDRDGEVKSEISGNAIKNDYDIVLHHKTPLTLQNVNDYAISLNRENILIVTQTEHNEIHNRFGYATQRKVYYVYGAPCSGKTTFVNNIKGNSDLVVDMDNIWQCITGGARYEKPNALKTTAFMIRNTLYDAVKNRAGRWERAFIITGGAVKGIRTREIESFGAEPIYIDTDKQTCLKRLANDNTRTPAQKAEWEKYIEQWFNDFQE